MPPKEYIEDLSILWRQGPSQRQDQEGTLASYLVRRFPQHPASPRGFPRDRPSAVRGAGVSRFRFGMKRCNQPPQRFLASVSMSVLVTGVAGFIGSHVARACAGERRAGRYRHISSDYYDPALKTARPEAAARGQSFTFLEADISDRGAFWAGQPASHHRSHHPSCRAARRASFACRSLRLRANQRDGPPGDARVGAVCPGFVTSSMRPPPRSTAAIASSRSRLPAGSTIRSRCTPPPSGPTS